MHKDTLKIVILGGGTAGWMTANLMAARWKHNNIHLTLVESPDIGTIGVGEGSTPSMQNFFQEIGVKDSEWMPQCNASYKNGITFVGWSSIPGFEQYCHPFPSKMDRFTFPDFDTNCQFKRHKFEVETHPDRFFLGAYLAQNSKGPKANDNFPFDQPNGYHFDSNLLGKFLAKKAKQRGVEQIKGHVEQVIQKENGDISGLLLKNGMSIRGDFFIDCSGFASVLIQKALKVPFISLDKVLFNDTAVVVATPTDQKQLSSQTKSTALKYGWAWDIPLTNRTGNGYVFSSRHCTVNDAETEFREHLGLLNADVNIRTVKWKQGRLEKNWRKNCLAVGLSQGFLEPIEAMALHLVYNSIGHFITAFENGKFTNQNQQRYNRMIARAFDGVTDYIVAHYRLNSRRDTSYWLDNAENTNTTSSLTGIIQSWMGATNTTLADEIKKHDTDSYFPLVSWQILFAGYGVFPPSEKMTPESRGYQSVNMRQLDDFILRCASNYNSHDKSLSLLK